MTADEWVSAALAAAVEQLGSVAIQDPDALDDVATVFTDAKRTTTITTTISTTVTTPAS